MMCSQALFERIEKVYRVNYVSFYGRPLCLYIITPETMNKEPEFIKTVKTLFSSTSYKWNKKSV